jgi:hypothetical protein
LSYIRHLLVVAVQCEAEQELARLDEAADDLCSALIDETIGACKPGLPDGRAILSGKDLTADGIHEQVRIAIRHAGTNDATLILAFLGHGFVPGQTPTLHLMASDSLRGVRANAVNVRDLLVQATDMPGINGVIGIIDTCTAAAGTPSIVDLVSGTRGGRTRCQLLMAAAMNQSAYDLRMSRTIVEIIRRGIVGPRDVLTVSSITSQLREELVGQDTVSFHYDGDPFYEEELWLAHNQLHTLDQPASASVLSGAKQLLPLLQTLELPAIQAHDRNPANLQKLHQRLLAITPSPERDRALNVVDSLQVASKTTMFLRSYLPEALSSSHFRRAMAVAEILPAPAALAGDAAMLENLALRYPVSDGTCRAQLAKFLVALVVDAGRDPRDRELQNWATSVGGIMELNNAVESIQRRTQARRVRLIVSLHASLAGGWPDTLVAWLLYDGKLYQRADFPSDPNQPGVETALIEAVDWAEDHARRLGLKLQYVDVAIPTALLLQWRPEEVAYVQRLGLEYEVVTRWSNRLKRSKQMARAINHSAKRLAEIVTCGTVAPVDWLGKHDLTDLARLRDQLVNGRYSKALALAIRPRDAEDLMTLLLTYSPIVLWPDAVDEFSGEKRECLVTCWHRMPGEFLNMYRMRWRGQPTGHAADLRAVWDDDDWLNFCRSFQHEEPTVLRSTL